MTILPFYFFIYLFIFLLSLSLYLSPLLFSLRFMLSLPPNRTRSSNLTVLAIPHLLPCGRIYLLVLLDKHIIDLQLALARYQKHQVFLTGGSIYIWP